MQTPQKRQTGSGLPFEQHQDDGEIGEHFTRLSKRLVVFKHLPIAGSPSRPPIE